VIDSLVNRDAEAFSRFFEVLGLAHASEVGHQVDEHFVTKGATRGRSERKTGLARRTVSSSSSFKVLASSLVNRCFFKSKLPNSDSFFAGLFALREYFGVLAGVLLLPVVETSNKYLVALLDFHSHFPGNVDSLVIEVSVEAQ